MSVTEKLSSNKNNLWDSEEINNRFVSIEIARVTEKTQIRKFIESVMYLLENMDKLVCEIHKESFLNYKINTEDYKGIIDSLNERIEKEDKVKTYLESLNPDIFSCCTSNEFPGMSVSYRYGYICMPMKSACLLYDILRIYDLWYDKFIRADKHFYLYAPDKRTIEDSMYAVSAAIGREMFIMYSRYHQD